MNTFLHRSEDRGHVKAGWLDTKHSFSFGSWYNPKYMGVGSLRVINDDTIAAHNGFGTHPHDNMEILTCVLKGTISHKDSMGNERHINAGEWQLIVGPNDNAPMHIRQDAEIKAAYLEKGHTLEVKATQKFNYVHLIEGEIDIAGQTLKAGDAYLFDEDAILNANENSQFIWFDLNN
ncbi:pirin family protein [Acinetobacter sichuanensis]|uniref:pirin family protein n=1 Tax=Acinetobacter sichuanensis TaxID=2136183 RepID=UPI00280C59C0|nr:pirin family protein [Acinetobacter sichuanensis]MDQ9019859.1 pirin family protein [Acinetobacter sichuanensis]